MDKIDRDIKNFLAVIHDLASRAEEWISRPSWIEFATNNYCNLKCIMCSHADGEPKIKMHRDDAERIMEEALPSASLLLPSAGSEPFLGDFDLVMAQCRKHDVYINLVTNATILNGHRFRNICERIQKVHISFDSHIPEIYERIRAGAKYEKVLGNIKEILKVAAEEKTPLGFVVVLMAENAVHLPEYVDFIADIGGTEARAEIRIQRMIHIASQCKDQEVNARYTSEQLHGIFDRVLERATSRKINMLSELEAPFNGAFSPVSPYVRGVSGDVLIQIIETIKERYPHFCSMASHYMKINPNGSVYPCCRAPGELIMGNALETSVAEIWNGEKFRSFRRRMHSGDYLECCSTCDVLIDNPHFKKLQHEKE